MNYNFQDLNSIFEKMSPASAEDMIKLINTHRRIFVHGAGRTGLMLKAFAMRLAQAGYTVYAAGEVVTPAIEEGDLLIVASASGTTASILHSAQTARKVGAFILTLTASPDSPVCTCSDHCIFLDAPTKDAQKGGSIMGTLFEQSVLLFCDHVMASMSMDAADMRKRHANLE